MGSHNEFAESFAAKAVGENHLVPPADGGTIDLRGTDGAMVLYNTSSAITGKLPASTQPGVTVYVSNRSTGTVTVQNPSSVMVDTVAYREIKGFISAGDSTWNLLGGVSPSVLAGVTSTTGGNLVGYDDSGNKTSAATVANALDEIYVHLRGTERVWVPLTAVTEEDGTPLTVAGADSGFAQLDNKNTVIQIPVNATTEAFAFVVGVPSEIAWTQGDGVTVRVLASKSADDDTLTLDAEAYLLTVAEGWSADVYEGAAVAITETLGNIDFVLSDADDPFTTPLIAIAVVLTLGGTNDGDVVYIHDISILNEKRLLTS